MLIGIDEAGRGCWAGPLVAAAVRLCEPIDGLMDSKQLTPVKRERLALLIREFGDVGIGWVSAQVVDEIGLTAAVSQAMRNALNTLNNTAHRIVIDGNYNYLVGTPRVETMIKADTLIDEVSAASIIAKTTRDAYMRKISTIYPQYHFERHVGYGTALHRTLLNQYGPCTEHRLSYKPVKVASISVNSSNVTKVALRA